MPPALNRPFGLRRPSPFEPIVSAPLASTHHIRHNLAFLVGGVWLMWFKNLCLFRLTAPFNLSAEDLHARLLERAFTPCASTQLESEGWVAPLGRAGEQLTHAANGCILMCARREEKILPAAVVRELVDEQVVEIEEQEARRVRRGERDRIRDEIVLDLLPRALTRSRHTSAYLSVADGWLVIDAGSLKAAEAFVALLRQTLGSLPVVPCVTKTAPAAVLTSWLADKAPADITLGEEYELRESGDDGAIVRCRRQDPEADEVQSHLRSGKQVMKLAIAWSDRLSCVVDTGLHLRRLRFSDIVEEERAGIETDDAAGRFDADFSLMTLELARFIPRLLEMFGGEDEQAYAPAEQAA